ncbi:response regulator [Massilia sp. TSP1-1-2]|uniref:response regulator n=1 Tax=Massilia sp. TSP1-1-2 TaxID=2804649 RepID=UPI003CF9E7D5
MSTDECAALRAKIAGLEQQLALLQAGSPGAAPQQDAFLSLLTHELRNPLAPIIMASSMLAKLPGATPELLKLQAIIARQAAHLSGVLDELLDTARLQRGDGGVSSAVPATLPLCRPLAASGAKARRILLIEDNRDASDTLRMLLAAEGHHVTVAFDGIAGLGLARAQSFDVLVCDIGLPGMDGLELIGQLRRSLGMPIPFAIAISGFGRTADRERAIGAGFGHYFVKPVDVAALLALVASDAVTGFIAASQRR